MSKYVSYRSVANVDWQIFQSDGATYSNDQVQLAVLLDIREQLKTLNRTLACYRVQQMADAMIELNKRAKAKGWPLRRKRKARSAAP